MLIAAAPALASTARISSANRIVVTGQGSERNSVRVSYDLGMDLYTVTDGAGVTGSDGCVDVDANTVTCPGAGVVAVSVNTGAGNDLIALDRATMPATIAGALNGGSGNDHISGADADDSLHGGSGRDLLDGGPGADDLRGGRGSDLAYYGDRVAGVAVSVGAGNANDGNAVDQSGNSRDTVRGDIETVIGSAGGDFLVGDRSDEALVGGEGDDTLLGGRGNDLLLGGGGNDLLSGENGRDLLRGEDGNDRLRGGSGDDRLFGGPGDDIIKGQSGVDVMKGNRGIDRIFARDGTRDKAINCGPGNNRLEKAKRDRGKRNKRNNDPRARSC